MNTITIHNGMNQLYAPGDAMSIKHPNQPIRYQLPKTSIFSKNYDWNTKFAEQDWSDWVAVVRGFHSRINDWYFAPLAHYPETGHEAYPVLCAMCALVETLAHYYLPAKNTTRDQYTKFLPVIDPLFSTKLSKPITISRRAGKQWKIIDLLDFSEVFYAGVRCSLHHHGDLEPFAGMSRTGALAQELPNAGQSVCRKYSYSIVVFDPWVLREKLESWFGRFCHSLESTPTGQRAAVFRRRFAEDFAIKIPKPNP